MSAYDSIKQALGEALAFADGKEAGVRIHQVEVPAVDVVAIRASTGLSQGAFARSIGVAKGTLLNWEHGAPTSYRTGAGAARDDCQEAFAGERVTALVILSANMPVVA